MSRPWRREFEWPGMAVLVDPIGKRAYRLRFVRVVTIAVHMTGEPPEGAAKIDCSVFEAVLLCGGSLSGGAWKGGGRLRAFLDEEKLVSRSHGDRKVEFGQPSGSHCALTAHRVRDGIPEGHGPFQAPSFKASEWLGYFASRGTEIIARAAPMASPEATFRVRAAVYTTKLGEIKRETR